MTISTRLKLNILMSAIVVLIMSGVFGLALMIERDAVERDVFGDKLMEGISELNEVTEYYLRHPEERPKEQWKLTYDSLSEMLSKPPRRQGKNALIDRMRLNLSDLGVLFKELTATYETDRAGPEGPALLAKRQQLADLIAIRSRKISQAAASIAEEGTAEMEDVNRNTAVFFPVFAVVMVVITVWSSMRIRRSIEGPIKHLHHGAEIIGSGKLDHRVGSTAPDEIGDLSRAFDDMTIKLGAITVSRDDMKKEIEERKRAEEALQHILRRFELLANTAGELLQTSEPQRAVESLCLKVMEHLDCHTFFNFLADDRAGRLRLNACAGIPEEEIRKIEWLDYGVAICGCAARDGCRIVAEHIPTTPDERNVLVKSYGIKAYCCHPLQGPGGKVIGTLSFGTRSRETFSEDDLSLMKAVADQVAVAMNRMAGENELRHQTGELETVNRELEAFIYSIAHDLRTPLRSISVFSKCIKEDYQAGLDDKAKDYLARIHRGSEKMARLIDDLLRLSKLSRQEIDRITLDMSGLAASIVSSLGDSDPGRKVEFSLAEGLTAFADPRLMEAVLSNLLGNAWKFTSKTENARIEFGAVREEIGRIGPMGPVYFVKDNGAGFDAEYADKMFRPFHRLHSESEFEGMGIGLTIVERIIHRHGGKVWAEGEPGKGATIYFTLG